MKRTYLLQALLTKNEPWKLVINTILVKITPIKVKRLFTILLVIAQNFGIVQRQLKSIALENWDGLNIRDHFWDDIVYKSSKNFDKMEEEIVTLNAEPVSKLSDNVVQIKVEQGAKEVLVQFLK